MSKKKTVKGPAGVLDMLTDVFRDIYKDLKDNFLSHIPKWKKKIEKELRLAQKKFCGQKVSLIGPPATGKTTMLKVLRNPEIEKKELEEYKKTGAGEFFDGFKVKWNVPVTDDSQVDFTFKIAAGLDNGGEDYIREGHWLESIQKSEIVFYLFDFEKLNKPETMKAEQERILKDFDWLGQHVNSLSANFSIILVGNKVDVFCSTLREFRKLNEEKQKMLNELHHNVLECIPKGYFHNIKKPVLISLFDKKIRNEQFADLMLSVMGKTLIDIIKECHEIDRQSNEEAA